MKKLVLLIFATVILNGCATYHPTIPEGYSGPTATIRDSAKSIDRGKADIFYLSHIDGKEIESSNSKTFNASYGQGDNLSLVLLDNSVPAQEHVFKITGWTVYAMPIRAMFGDVYSVEGEVTFTPEQNETYIVKGQLSEEKSEVWIERLSDGEVIDKFEKVE